MCLGVAACDEPTDPIALLRAADEALYRAKRGGRDRVESGRAPALALALCAQTRTDPG